MTILENQSLSRECKNSSFLPHPEGQGVLMVSTAEAGCLLVLTPSQEVILDRVIQMARLEPMNTHRLPGIFLKVDSEQQPVVSGFPPQQEADFPGQLEVALPSLLAWKAPWRTVVPALLTLAHAWCSQSSCVTEDAPPP